MEEICLILFIYHLVDCQYSAQLFEYDAFGGRHITLATTCCWIEMKTESNCDNNFWLARLSRPTAV